MPDVNAAKVVDPTAPEKGTSTKELLRENFSIFTAASESELGNSLRSYASRFQLDTGTGVRATPDAARHNILLNVWLRRVRLCALTGSAILGSLFLIYLLDNSITTAIGCFLFMLAIGSCGIWGYRQGDWRPLVAFFIFSFILLGYAAACVVLTVVMRIAQSWFLRASSYHTPESSSADNSGSETYPRLSLGVTLVSILFNILFAVFWGYTTYVAGKAIRLILGISETTSGFSHHATAGRGSSVPRTASAIEGTRVGHPVNDSFASCAVTRQVFQGKPGTTAAAPFDVDTKRAPTTHQPVARENAPGHPTPYQSPTVLSVVTPPTDDAHSVEDIPLSPYTSKQPLR